MLYFLKPRYSLTILILSFCLATQAQQGKVWVTIANRDLVPFFGDNRELQSKDSILNEKIKSLSIIHCEQALPASKRKALQMVYELTCNCSQTELELVLSTQVPALSQVLPAPVYDTLQTPNDYSLVTNVNNYALNLINAQTAWDITTGDTNVVIAIADQNYNPLHSEIAGKYVVLNTNTATTTHGNAVAIVAAGNTNNNNGMSSIGYNCKLGLYLMNYNSVLSAAYAGYKVINLSWSSGCFYNSYAQQVIDEAYDQGAFILAAAGNGSTCGNPSSLVYPSAYANVFSVTSIGANDNHMKILNDTNSTHQHNYTVDLSAPGYDVAVNPAEGWFINSSGTSFATPYVSGTVGLMLSINPCLSRKDIDTILRISSVNIDTLNPLYVGKIGAGRLNAQAAVQLASGWTTNPMSILSQPVSITTGLGNNVQFTATSSSSFPVCQWQYDSSGVFVNLFNNNIYSGVNTPSLTITNTTQPLHGTQYRCIMQSGLCEAITNVVTLSVLTANLPDSTGPIQSVSSVCVGDSAIFNIDTVANATGYNWVVSGNNIIISGQNTTSISVIIYDTATQVSVTPYSSAGLGTTSTTTIMGIPTPTSVITGSTSICAGDSAVLNIQITGAGPFSGMLNGTIPFSGNSNSINVVVWPDTTTIYWVTDLQGLCIAGSDQLVGTAIVKVSPLLLDTIQQTICNNQLPYQWHGFNINTPGMYTDTFSNSSGCDSVLTLSLNIISGNAPAAPATITQTLVSNQCYQRIYRYTASITANATGYQWSIPTSCGGIPIVTVDSGDINSSRVIRLKYFSNAAAYLTDSIKVRAYNLCGYGPYRRAKLINTALNVPSTPASITVTPLQTNICGGRRYRYKAPNLPIGTSTITAATGYLWSFSTPTPLQAQLDSGTLNSQVIVVKYLSNSAAAPTDSIYLQYTSACGNSNKRALKLAINALNSPTAPASVTITALNTSTCGNRRYRFTMPVMPNATLTLPAANGYLWTPTGNLANYGVLDSGSFTSRVMIMKYTADFASQIGDSIKAQFNSDCGLSLFRAVKFSVPKLSAPNAPVSILITPVSVNICGARKYRYTAPNLPLGTTLLAIPTGYVWSMPTGNVGSTGSLDSGTLNSQKIIITYSSNAAAAAGDSIRLRYSSSCGNSAIKAQKLSNTVLNGCPIIARTIQSKSKQYSSDLQVKVSPNPSASYFQLHIQSNNSERISWRVTDIQGKTILNRYIQSGDFETFGHDWKPGFYFMEVSQGIQSRTQKLIKW